ncbi:hypothetical protein EG68_05915 [Paragonimus skrjabini miyazakii]|uniref:N-acetyltransferase domain-containing protein n=1 Tax=Paragonimus skrjabini miyazakii TaxID=59628 RepID=A0A8S9YQH4_9TREM|nr:hypothetical protein EG68_05915 [Paragonimus skrjabini miyazakii]
MRVNESIVVETGRLFFVPYCSIHVPRYHQWMLNEDLRCATSSDLLSLEEEFEAQRQWAELDDRLTFIILSKDRLASLENSTASSLDDFENVEVNSMIGDVNLFLHPVDVNNFGANDECFEGELSVMIAEPDMRGRGLASEALAALLEFSGRHLASRLSGLVAKVSMGNPSSIKLFSSHLKFIERNRCAVFNQVDFIPPPGLWECGYTYAEPDAHRKSMLATSRHIVNCLNKFSPGFSAVGWHYSEHDLSLWRATMSKGRQDRICSGH